VKSNNSKPPPKSFALGKHMTIEYYDCDPHILADTKLIEKAFLKAAKDSNATIIGSDFHYFEPQGVSGFVVIAESHFSVHAWPEHDYAAVDIFTCGDSINFEAAVNSLKKELKSDETIISSVMNRGITSNNGVEKLVPVFEDRTHLYALSWKKKFEASNAWGLSTSIDIYNCNPEQIRDAEAIKEFVKELCKKVKMTTHGETQVEYFGKNERIAGFSMTQLLNTSLISGHFANATDTAYIDIFSCKFYEPREAAEFAIQFFEGSNYRMQTALRR